MNAFIWDMLTGSCFGLALSVLLAVGMAVAGPGGAVAAVFTFFAWYFCDRVLVKYQQYEKRPRR